MLGHCLDSVKRAHFEFYVKIHTFLSSKSESDKIDSKVFVKFHFCLVRYPTDCLLLSAKAGAFKVDKVFCP